MDNNYIGKKVDNRYDVISLIGVGGMSNVYKAIDTLTGETVAIKFLKHEFFENEELVRRFKNESKAISLLDNPNIIKVIDVNINDNEKYIVVEYIDGITLKEYIDNRKVLTWQETVSFTGTILSAISHAHDNGIIHRDLKPHNIMLLRDGTLKIMDFGIARLSTANQKTVTDKAIGSVHYISPEQVRGKNSDGRSDIYSIGIMMYEMLTGVLPFVSDSAVSVAMKQVQETAKKPTEIVDTIPAGLEQIVLKAIEKQPSFRYQSAQEMLKDLQAFKSNPAIIFPYGEDEKTQTVVVNKVADKKPAKKVKVKKGFRVTLPVMAGVAAAFFVSAIVACFMILKSNNSPLLSKQPDVELPSFVGMYEADVKNNKDFKYEVEYLYSGEYEQGVVMSQNPKPPKTIKAGGLVKLKVSQGPMSSQIQDLSNYSRGEAERILKELEVNVVIKTIADKKIDRGYVVKTDPEKGTIIHSGDTVTLYVSSGDPDNKNKTFVVGVTGNQFSDASKILAKSNLVVGTYSYREDGSPYGTVIEQHPQPGTEVVVGSTVSLVISSGPPKCSVCGSTDHREHPVCEFCESVEHITEKHICKVCGAEGAHADSACPESCQIHLGQHKANSPECPNYVPPSSGDGGSEGDQGTDQGSGEGNQGDGTQTENSGNTVTP